MTATGTQVSAPATATDGTPGTPPAQPVTLAAGDQPLAAAQVTHFP